MLALVEGLIVDGRAEEAEQLGRGLIERNKDFTPIYAARYVYYVQTSQFERAELTFPPRDDTAPLPGTAFSLAAGGASLAWRRFKKLRSRSTTPRSG